jgi:mRNA interferase RelE/StbE
MIVEFLKSFRKDLIRVKSKQLKESVKNLIDEMESANSLSEIKNVKKLKGHSSAYRIRIGDYRIGVFFENGIIELARIVHRKDIYNVFP